MAFLTMSADEAKGRQATSEIGLRPRLGVSRGHHTPIPRLTIR
jgi:hypothetical protein